MAGTGIIPANVAQHSGALYQIQSKYKYKQTDKYREADTKYAKRKSAITSYRGGTRYDGPTPPKMETQSHANTKTKK